MFFSCFFASAGCISLAADGVCLIPSAAVLKKDEKDKLQCGINYEHHSLLVVLNKLESNIKHYLNFDDFEQSQDISEVSSHRSL